MGEEASGRICTYEEVAYCKTKVRSLKEGSDQKHHGWFDLVQAHGGKIDAKVGMKVEGKVDVSIEKGLAHTTNFSVDTT